MAGSKRRNAKKNKSTMNRKCMNNQIQGSSTVSAVQANDEDFDLKAKTVSQFISSSSPSNKIFERMKKDIARRFELKWAYLKEAVATGKIRPEKYDAHDPDCPADMKEETFLETVLVYDLNTLTVAIDEITANDELKTDEIALVLKKIHDYKGIMYDQLEENDKMNRMIAALRTAADEKEKLKKEKKSEVRHEKNASMRI
ncbi:hypothetical protein PRIPAC_91053 [Pristionchus pacificus]|uniref:Uncharacterized protein n=1 Tax=Pristionchus pacificus TaxID=54126 RepID=A0A2A6B647_PRIPA|nr:hypothetical protein PRIPAC_91053 [Pristionchus pacificus]|eukprot:PDM61359.1 hypothetical protein PRIPAC_50801 [Pristionchus pacificus]